MFTNIPGGTPAVLTTKNVSRYCQMSLGGQNHPRWELLSSNGRQHFHSIKDRYVSDCSKWIRDNLKVYALKSSLWTLVFQLDCCSISNLPPTHSPLKAHTMNSLTFYKCPTPKAPKLAHSSNHHQWHLYSTHLCWLDTLLSLLTQSLYSFPSYPVTTQVVLGFPKSKMSLSVTPTLYSHHSLDTNPSLLSFS